MSVVNIQNFSYQHPDRDVLFVGISLHIEEGRKVALVGRNGIGKTTLLQIINNNVFSDIKIKLQPYNIPQHTDIYKEQTIAEVLRVNKKLEALKAIIEGNVKQKYFDALEDSWDIEHEIRTTLNYWGLYNVKFDTKLHNLSGGEQVKVFLSGLTLHQPQFVIMDEPTNHLDSITREKLYKWIDETSATLLIVSHDRDLLNLLTDIYELSANNVSYYPGNYDSYAKQKEYEHSSLIKRIESQKQEVRKAEKIQQEVTERRQKQELRGERKNAKKSLPRIIANARKSMAQGTTAGLASIHKKRVNSLDESIQTLQERVDKTKMLKIKLEDSILHQGKTLVEAKEVNYSYNETSVWERDLTFMIKSGDRILIKGANGSGKTTLIKLIIEEFSVTKGNFKAADFTYLYLDQSYSLIETDKTVYQQAQSYNINMPKSEVKMNLVRSQLNNDSWNKPCSVLSGGEKMKLSLCSLMIGNKTPDMLILDEPTNNLDIDSMAILGSAITKYSGTILLISHDRCFVEEIGIDKEIDLDTLYV